MKLLKEFSTKSFNVLFFIVFSYLFITVALSSGNAIAFFAFASFILIALLMNLLIKNDEANNKTFYLFAFGFAIILFIGQIFVCKLNVYTPPKGDYEAIYTGIKELVNHGKFTDSAAYFLLYPHQLFSTICFAVLNRLFVVLGSAEPVNVVLTTSVISFFNSIGLFCACLGTKLLFSKKQAYIATAFLALNLNAYTGSVFIYPHSLSLAVLGPVFLLFSLALKQQKYNIKCFSVFLCLGISLAIAQLMEGIFAIGLVATLIYLLISCDLKIFLVKAGSIILGFIITLSCITLFYNALDVFDGVDTSSKKLPIEHWIMIGLSSDGKFNDADYNFSVNLPDTKTRQEQARKIIKQRLEGRSLSQLLAHINQKEVRNWSGHKYGPEIISSSNEINIVLGYNLALLFSLVILALKRLKANNATPFMIFQIWAVGIFLFFALWESSVYYLVSSTPIICMAAAAVIAQIDVKPCYIKIKQMLKK